MRAATLILAALIAAPALADSEVRQGADFVRITADPCTNAAVLANIAGRGENALDYRAARAEFQGAPYAACWRPDFPRKVLDMRYDDGDAGEVPFGHLKPVREV